MSAFWRYHAAHSEDAYFTRQLGERILEETRRFVPPNALVCDYGCGAGHLLARLVQRWQSAGVDFTAEAVAAARTRASGTGKLINVYLAGRDELPQGKFDVLYVVETVEHVLEEDLEDFFADLRRLLRARGRVIVTTPHDEDLSASTVFCPRCEHTFHRWQHVRSFTADTLREFMERGGFETERVVTTDFGASSPLRRLKARLRALRGRKNPHLLYIGRKGG